MKILRVLVHLYETTYAMAMLFGNIGCITDKAIIYHIIDNDNSKLDNMIKLFIAILTHQVFVLE